MTIEISTKIYKKFQRLEETQDLTDQETLEYFQEIAEDLLDDFVLERLNKQEENYETGGDIENEE